MNTTIINRIEYFEEMLWVTNKKKKVYDSKGVIKKYPEHKKVKFPNKAIIIERIIALNDILTNHYPNKLHIKTVSPMPCLICDKKNVTTTQFTYMKNIWNDGIIHYIEKHNIEPSQHFKNFIFGSELKTRLLSVVGTHKKLSRHDNKNTSNKVIIAKKIKAFDKDYVYINSNQLLILDALMIHGGYTKKYVNNNTDIMYSEHAGILDFDNNILKKIIVSGKTTRIDNGDDEIFLPVDMEEMLDYEYIFHTHPPTPHAGGRASTGILYEIPSTGDIFHFIDHYNKGNVIGSLVVTPEGLYNIRKNDNSTTEIKINDNLFFKKYNKVFYSTQKEYIDKYGSSFSPNYFYKYIAQDKVFMNKINNTLEEFNLHIDYYPRRKNKHGYWIMDNIYLVFRQNRIKIR